MKLVFVVMLAASLFAYGIVEAFVVDLRTYLPNVVISKTHDLVTASGERFKFLWLGAALFGTEFVWEGCAYQDFWQYLLVGSNPESLWYFYGNYICANPDNSSFWGEAPAIETFPRFWNNLAPFNLTWAYVGTQIRRDTVPYTILDVGPRLADTNVVKTFWNGQSVIIISMTEYGPYILKEAGSVTYEYTLVNALPCQGCPTATTRGVGRFRLMSTGDGVVKDMIFTQWIPK